MKPHECGNWRTRVDGLASAAGSIATPMAACFRRRRRRGGLVDTAPVSNPGHCAQRGIAKTGLGFAFGFLLLLVGPPWPAAGQPAAGTVVSWGGQVLPWVEPGTGFKAIAAGSAHTLAVKLDGTVVAWGDNMNGQSAAPEGLTGVVAVAASGSHSMALKGDGTVVAWGDNSFGENAVPAGLSGVMAIANGAGYCLALKTNGTVAAWGQIYDGEHWNAASVPANLSQVAAIAAGSEFWLALKQDGTVTACGQSSSGATNVPTGLSDVVAIAAGADHALALKRDGTVVAWGSNTYGESSVPTTLYGVTAIAAGMYHSLALQSNGQITAWGAGRPRQLGDPFYGQSSVPSGLKGATAIAAGDYHSAAIKQDGSVAAWGAGGPGQSGAPHNGQSTVPGSVHGMVAIAAGPGQSLALKQDGTVLGWSDEDAYGEADVPTNLTDVVAISGGGGHTLALRQNGTVVTWGGAAYGLTWLPSNLSNVVAIAAGEGFYSLALKQDGTVAAWGWWANGYTPVYVPARLADVTALAGGYAHCLALRQDGSVIAWGTNSSGQTNVPNSLGPVKAIAAGVDHSLALKLDGTVVAWGGNTQGQSTVPPGLTGVVAIAAGPYHSLAIQRDGTVVAWGENYLGVSTVPDGLAGAMMVASEDYVTLALIGLPTVDSPPSDQTVTRDAAVQFQVQADGPGPLAYQWFFNNATPITDATNAVLQLTDVQLSDSGDYSVVVSNRYGTATSSPALLTVAAAPVIANSPMSQNAFVDDTIEFPVAAVGVSPLAYQWYFGSAAIRQATNATLRLPGLQLSQAGNYWVVITNVYGATTSLPATLAVDSPVTVSNCTEAALRAALDLSKKVVFTADGTINLSNSILINSKTVLAANGHRVTLSGKQIARVFYVGGDGDLTLENLVIADGCGDYGTGDYGADVYGAGIYNEGAVTAINCTFTNNAVVGQIGLSAPYWGETAGTAGGNGAGGAIWNSGILRVSGCTFVDNSATGGAGGQGAAGEPIQYPENQGYPGGPGGDGMGGAVFNCGTAYFVNCTLASNTSQGGAGGPGGPGGIYSPDYPPGSPGPAGAAGAGSGAIYDADGQCYLTNCTIADNSGTGIWTIGTNGAQLMNTLVSGNSPGGNGAGAMVDLGHNLSSDSTCAFTGAGSMNNTNPDLGPLADHGGPTWTMALWSGSPAIDAGSAVGAPPTDQRGVARPQGSGVDIGAFEYLFRPVFTGASVQTTTNRQMQLCGLTPNPALTLQASTNLLNWWNVTQFTAGANGEFQILDPIPGNTQSRFYRLKSDAP